MSRTSFVVTAQKKFTEIDKLNATSSEAALRGGLLDMKELCSSLYSTGVDRTKDGEAVITAARTRIDRLTPLIAAKAGESLHEKQAFEQKQIAIRLAASPPAAGGGAATPKPVTVTPIAGSATAATAASIHSTPSKPQQPPTSAFGSPLASTPPQTPQPHGSSAGAGPNGFATPMSTAKPATAPVHGTVTPAPSGGAGASGGVAGAAGAAASPAIGDMKRSSAVTNPLFAVERKRTGVDWDNVKIDKFGRVKKDTTQHTPSATPSSIASAGGGNGAASVPGTPSTAAAAAVVQLPVPASPSGNGAAGNVQPVTPLSTHGAVSAAGLASTNGTAIPAAVNTGLTADEIKRQKEALEVTRRHEMKWIAMTKDLKSWKSFSSAKIKERARKGIPDGLRGRAWSMMLGANELQKAYEKKTGETGHYARYAAIHDAFLDKEIHKDLDRTYPDHVFFRDPTRTGFTPGRISLYNVLKAYALFDKQVAYCQGMAFPTGLFLMYVGEEEAFWMLHSLLQHGRFKLAGLYADDIWQTRQCVFQLECLIKTHLPQLYKHILSTEPPVRVDVFATQWFMTFFLAGFSAHQFEVVLRIIDIMLSDDIKILFRVAMLLLKSGEKELLALPEYAELGTRLKSLHMDAALRDADKFILSALEIKMVSRDELVASAKVFAKDEAARKAEVAAMMAAPRASGNSRPTAHAATATAAVKKSAMSGGGSPHLLHPPPALNTLSVPMAATTTAAPTGSPRAAAQIAALTILVPPSLPPSLPALVAPQQLAATNDAMPAASAMRYPKQNATKQQQLSLAAIAPPSLVAPPSLPSPAVALEYEKQQFAAAAAATASNSATATPSTPGYGGPVPSTPAAAAASAYSGLSTPMGGAASPSASQSYAQWSTPALAGWATGGPPPDGPLSSAAAAAAYAAANAAAAGSSPFPRGTFAPVAPTLGAGVRTQKIKHSVGVTTEYANRHFLLTFNSVLDAHERAHPFNPFAAVSLFSRRTKSWADVARQLLCCGQSTRCCASNAAANAASRKAGGAGGAGGKHHHSNHHARKPSAALIPGVTASKLVVPATPVSPDRSDVEMSGFAGAADEKHASRLAAPSNSVLMIGAASPSVHPPATPFTPHTIGAGGGSPYAFDAAAAAAAAAHSPSQPTTVVHTAGGDHITDDHTTHTTAGAHAAAVPTAGATPATASTGATTGATATPLQNTWLTPNMARHFWLALLATFVFAVAFGLSGEQRQITTGWLMLANLLLNTGMAVWTNYLEHYEVTRLLRTRMEQACTLPVVSYVQTARAGANTGGGGGGVAALPPTSSSFVSTLRDGVWTHVPLNMLVKGDVVQLLSGTPAPCAVQLIDTEYAETVPPNAAAQAAAAAAAALATPAHAKLAVPPTPVATNKPGTTANGAAAGGPAKQRLILRAGQMTPKMEDDSDSDTDSDDEDKKDDDDGDGADTKHEKEKEKEKPPPPKPIQLAPARPSSGAAAAAAAIGFGASGHGLTVRRFAPEPKSLTRLYEVLEFPVTHQLQTILHSRTQTIACHDDDSGAHSDDATTLASNAAAALNLNSYSTPIQILRAPRNRFLKVFDTVTDVSHRVLLLGLCIHLVFVIVRLAATDSTSDWLDGWWSGLFVDSATLALPLLQLSTPFYLFLIDALLNAVLIATHERVHEVTELELAEQRKAASSLASLLASGAGAANPSGGGGAASLASPRAANSPIAAPPVRESSVSDTPSTDKRGGDDEDAELSPQALKFIELSVSTCTVLYHFRCVWNGSETRAVTRTVNPVQVLGNITVLCCLDKEGILSENVVSTEKILFIEEQAGENKPVILELVQDVDGMVFEGEWKDRLSSLKPVGLSAILNSQCNPFLRKDTSMMHGGGEGSALAGVTNHNDSGSNGTDVGCLCVLAKEIGFDVPRVRNQFFVIKTIKTIAKHVTDDGEDDDDDDAVVFEMNGCAIVNKAQVDSIQLLNDGDPALVLAHSSDFWGGRGLHRLTPPVRQKILEIYNHWRHQDLRCLAFSYSPVNPKYMDVFTSTGPGCVYLMEDRRHYHRNHAAAQALAASGGGGGGGGGVGFGGTLRTSLSSSDLATPTNRERMAASLSTPAHHFAPAAAGGSAIRPSAAAAGFVGIPEDRKMDDLHTPSGSAPPSTRPARRSLSHPESLAIAAAVSAAAAHAPAPVVVAHGSNMAAAADGDIQILPERSPSLASRSVSTGVQPGGVVPVIPVISLTAPVHAMDGGSGAPSAIPTPSPTPPPLVIVTAPNNTVAAVAVAPNGSALFEDIAVRPSLNVSAPVSGGCEGASTTVTPAAAGGGLGSAAAFAAALNAAAAAAGITADANITTTAPSSVVATPVSPPALSVGPSYTAGIAVTAVPASGAGAGAGTGSTNSTTPSPAATPSATVTASANASASAAAAAKEDTPVKPPTSPSLRIDTKVRYPPTNPIDTPMIHVLEHQSSASALHPRLSGTGTSGAPGHRPSSSGSGASLLQSAQQRRATSMRDEADRALIHKFKHLNADQIFLGMVAVRDQPKKECHSFVENCMHAGIRFVYFSGGDEMQTMAFGRKLGISADFNQYISLRDPKPGDPRIRRNPNKSQLPLGISAVRPHLRKVDNVPLLVSLFSDCTPSTVQEMIRIHQENGESVCCIGSSLRVHNTETFLQSDISFALDPRALTSCLFNTHASSHAGAAGSASAATTPAAGAASSAAPTPVASSGGGASGAQAVSGSSAASGSCLSCLMPCLGGGGGGCGCTCGGCSCACGHPVGPSPATAVRSTESSNDYLNSFQCAASTAITTVPCVLAMSSTTDLHQFTALVYEARRLLSGFSQCLWFAFSTYLALFMVLLVSNILHTPPILTGVQLLWLCWIIVPVLAMGLLASPRTPDIMTLISDKSTDEFSWNTQRKLVTYWFVRFAPSVAAYIFIFNWFLRELYGGLGSNEYYWGPVRDGPPAFENWDSDLLATQNYALVVFVFTLTFHAMGFVCRFHSILTVNPFRNRWWLFSSLLVISAQVAFAIVATLDIDRQPISTNDSKWLFLLLWPCGVILIDELVKYWSHREYKQKQKKARLNFETQLGMHSPK